MAYDIKYRQRVIDFLKEGHSHAEVSRTFKVGITSIRCWENLLMTQGNLKTKPLNRTFKKIDPSRLSRYIEEHPDTYLKEIASEFKCGTTAVFKALRKLKITLKKRSKFIEKEMNKNGKNLSRNYVRLITKK